MAIYEVGKGQYEVSDDIQGQQLTDLLDEIYETQEATRDGALGYSVDNAQKMIGKFGEVIGRYTGMEGVENFGSNIVAQQDKDIAEGRYAPDYQGSLTDQKGLDKLGWLGEKAAENLATSGVALGGSVAAGIAGIFSAPVALGIGAVTLATTYAMGTGEAALEAEQKTGDYSAGGSLAIGAVIALMDRFGAKGVVPTDKLINMTGKELVDELVEKGYKEAASELVKKTTNRFVREGVTEAGQENAIMAGTALQGGDYTVGEVVDRNIDSAALGGFMGAGTQSSVDVLASTVGQSKAEKLKLMEEGLHSELFESGKYDNLSDPQVEAEYNKLVQLSKVVDAASKGDKKAVKEATKFIDTAAADATLAQRLDTIATTGYPDADGKNVPYNTKDVDRDSNKGVRSLVDQAHTDISEEIKKLSGVLKELLKPDTTDYSSFESLMDVVLADSGIRLSKNKAKSMLSTQNFEAVDRLVGQTEEGQRLLNLMRESNALTDVHLNDYVGGISKYTDQFSPFGVHTGYDSGKSVANVARMAGSAALAANTSGVSTAVQGGIAGAGRMLGSGSRSTVDNYIRNNAGGQPMRQQTRPDVPSVMQQANAAKVETERQKAAELARKEAEAQQAAQQQQQLEQANRVLGQRQAPPTDESPQWTMETATGLDKQGVAIALRMLERLPTFADQPAIRQAVEGYRKTVDTGGKVPNLSPLIRAVNMVANENPQFIQRVAEPNQQVEQQQAQVDKTEAHKQTEGYQRGIEANLKFGSDLMDAMNADKSIEPVVKAKLGNALKQIQLNLSEDPVGTLQSLAKGLADDGVPANLIEQYLGPYAERVARQQKKPVPPPSDLVVADRPNTDTNYRGQHQPSSPEDGAAPLWDMTGNGEVFPADIYSANGLRYYGNPNSEADLESYEIISSVMGDPDAEVTIYRAVPDEADIDTINVGDFVTLSRTYAGQHGESGYGSDGQGKGKILSKTVKARDVYSEGNDLNEFGYFPNKADSSLILDDRPNTNNLWSIPSQAFDSSDTSINSGKLPAGYGKLKKMGVFEDGQVVVDIGGGRFDNAVDDLAKQGVTVKVYDPFNRSPIHNEQVSSEVRDGGADIAVSHNVLNVIKEPENMAQVIQQAHNAVPAGNKAYFTVYAKNGSGKGEETSKGWQRNERTKAYVPRIEEVFGKGNVEVKNDIVIATKAPSGSTPSAASDPFNIGDDMGRTILGMYPTEGAKSPFTVKTKVEGIKKLFTELYAKTTGTTDPIEQTPENVDTVAKTIATEAMRALEEDSTAIGWYDRVLDRAMTILEMTDPDVAATPELETTFKYGLAVTSNGQAVDDNFRYAVDVFNFFKQNGRLPETKKEFEQGGKNNTAMLHAFKFFNEYTDVYNQGDTPLSLQEFLSANYRRGDLDKFIKAFNEEHGTKLTVGTSESVDTIIKGSYVMGPKIGQGFYQNLTGNYEPLTTDIWWMRMFNRHIGRPLEPRKSEAHMKKSKAAIIEKIKSAKKGSMQFDIVKDALSVLGEKKGGLYTDDSRLTPFLKQLQTSGNKWYKEYKKENGVNPKLEKGNLYTLVKTYNNNSVDQPQEAPSGPKERQFMREVTSRAIDLLGSQGIDITTADFQALMWYPEKRLFKMIGVKSGNGSDNDYEDAARLLAAKQGISNEQIEETLSKSGRGTNGVSGGAMSRQQDERFNNRTGSASAASTAGSPALTIPSYDSAPSLEEVTTSFPPVSKAHQKKAKEVLEGPAFNIGKEGDALEHGIQNQYQLALLGRAFNTKVEFVSNALEYEAIAESMGHSTGGYHGGWFGRFMPHYQMHSGTSYSLTGGGIAFVKDLPANQSMKVATHEVSHGITLFNGQGGKNKPIYNPINQRQKDQKVVDGSFQDYFFDLINDLPTKQRKKVIKEVMSVQRDMSFSTLPMREAGETTPFRYATDGMNEYETVPYNEGMRQALEDKKKWYRKIENLGAESIFQSTTSPKEGNHLSDSELDKRVKDEWKESSNDHERGYLSNPAESIVDPFMLAISDPKKAKEVTPEFYQMVKDFFNNGNSPLKFFSMLLALMFAIDEGEEEERRKQLAQGALSPQGQGALAAV